MADIEDLDGQLQAVETAAGGAAQMSAAFRGELDAVRAGLQTTGGDLATFEKGLSRGFKSAINGLVQDGDSLGDALRNIFSGVSKAAYNAAVNPVADHLGAVVSRGLGGLLGSLLPFENGAPFSQGRVMPFANGGIVSRPVTFPMRGGTGLMGEAGPEAIMPLARGADGKLGVRGTGGTTQVVMNIQTPDVEGFRRSQGQIANQLSRALARGQRNR